MHITTRFLFSALILVASLGLQTASAGEGTLIDKMIEQKFKAADKNGDGKLTLDEAKAGMPRVAKNFDKIDADHEGYVTLEQIKAASAKEK
ncbi:EF-hand domain-containing protein [Gammaproteobacteria bacterium]